MADLDVHIVTPEREVYHGPASSIRVPGWEGEFDVLPGHDMFLALVKGGVLAVATPGGAQKYVIGRGFAEVGDDKVVLLTDRCESGDAIDKAKAKEDLDAAEKVLAEGAEGTREWEAAIEKRDIAVARIFA